MNVLELNFTALSTADEFSNSQYFCYIFGHYSVYCELCYYYASYHYKLLTILDHLKTHKYYRYSWGKANFSKCSRKGWKTKGQILKHSNGSFLTKSLGIFALVVISSIYCTPLTLHSTYSNYRDSTNMDGGLTAVLTLCKPLDKKMQLPEDEQFHILSNYVTSNKTNNMDGIGIYLPHNRPYTLGKDIVLFYNVTGKVLLWYFFNPQSSFLSQNISYMIFSNEMKKKPRYQTYFSIFHP